GAFHPKFDIVDAAAGDTDVLTLNGAQKVIKIVADNTLYFHNCIKLFFANGGTDCYILSIGTYQGKDSLPINVKDLDASD
ncbi:hypothetical protein ABTL37_20290, partial [Acinetobacter baumannii]